MRFLVVLLACLTSAFAQESPLVKAARSTKLPPLPSGFQNAPPLRPVRWYNSPPLPLDHLRGRVVLLDFWATWCGPCVRGHPLVAALASKFPKDQFTAILVHARNTHRFVTAKDGRALREEIPAEQVVPVFIASHKITLPVAIAGDKDFESFGIEAIPQYILLDPEGKIRYDSPGKLPSEQDVRELLPKKRL